MPGSRPSLSEITGVFREAEKKRQKSTQSDKVGNELIVSSRLLSGREMKETKLKPPPSLSQKKRPKSTSGRPTTSRRSTSNVASSKTRGKALKRTQSSRRHGRKDSSAKRKFEEKRSSLDYDARLSSHRTERNARGRSRSRARSLFRRPSSPKRQSKRRSRHTQYLERSTRQRKQEPRP